MVFFIRRYCAYFSTNDQCETIYQKNEKEGWDAQCQLGGNLYPTCFGRERWQKKQKSYAPNTVLIFCIIQSIASPKAEPFKQRLAQVWYERIQEINDPELAQERMKKFYEAKGYSKERIDKRLRGISVRQTLTDERKERWIQKGNEYWYLLQRYPKRHLVWRLVSISSINDWITKI